MTRRSFRLAAILAAFTLSLPLLGCGSQAPNHAPPPPSTMVDRIKNNPYMSPAQREAALQMYQTHRAMASQRGAVLPGGKKH